MILFLISLFLVFVFAFFTASLIDSKNIVNNIIYFFLSGFAIIVLILEILSLFSKISVNGVLFLNIVFTLCAFSLWISKKHTCIVVNFKEVLQKLRKALILDKTLLVLVVCLLFMLSVSLWLVSFIQSSDAASVFYHVVRTLFWVENSNLNHFNYADARALVFPINSELLYTWVILFLKKDIFLGFFSIAGYVLYITALYGVLGKFTCSLRPKLWVILMVSSFTAVITYLSSTETNIIVAALILAGLYLYFCYLEKSGMEKLYMSSLAFVLAIGTKTSALIVFPAALIWIVFVGFYYKNTKVLRILGYFLAFFFLNFILFSSYNYILNLLNYGSFIGISSVTVSHQNLNGMRGFSFNLINYILMMFQLPEYERFVHIYDIVFNFKKFIINSLNLTPYIGVYSNDTSHQLIESARSGFGIIGLLVFIPSLIIAFIRVFLTRAKKEIALNSFSILFLMSFLIMTYSLVYMSYNIRFIVTFALISAPVLYYSYCKNYTFYKILTSIVAILYFIYIPLNITNKNVLYILNYMKKGYNISQVREIGYCSSYAENAQIYPVNNNCFLRDYIKQFNKKNKFLYFSQEGDGFLILKLLQFEGYKIDVGLIENLNNIDLSKYNIVISMDNRQDSTIFHNFDKSENGYFVENGVVCEYKDVDGMQILSDERSKPYLSSCRFNNTYFPSKMFSVYNIRTYTENFNNYSNHYNYYFYENLNNPVIK